MRTSPSTPFVLCVPQGTTFMRPPRALSARQISALLERAIGEQRLLVTFDRDFGELVVRHPRRPTASILLLRFIPTSASEVTEFFVALLARTDVDWSAHISVFDGRHVRQRPI